MDIDPPSSGPRKVKFRPKGPPRRSKTPIEPKTEELKDEDDNGADEALLRRAKEHLTRQRPKPEKKSSVQVAFSPGAASNSIRSFGKQRESKNVDDQYNAKGLTDYENSDQLISTDTEILDNFAESTSTSRLSKKKEYKEPWDYGNSYYPVTLPWRPPYSGDPEVLNEAEFGEAAANEEYDENATTSASDLGLLVEVNEPQLVFLQFPPNLPLRKRPTRVSKKDNAEQPKSSTASETNQKVTAGNAAKGKEKVTAGNVAKVKETSTSSTHPMSSYGVGKGCSLEELPEGYMGKMLVYKSGAVKLKMGDILYDVSPGVDCEFAQNVVAVNTVDRRCCDLGKPTKRAVVTPDMDFLLDHVVDLG